MEGVFTIIILTFLHWASLSSLVALITLSSRTPMKELPQVWKQLSVSVTQCSPVHKAEMVEAKFNTTTHM